MHESGEDYLETIYLLSKEKKNIHAVDIANEFNYSKPSITRAMNILKDKGYITVDSERHILLTERGLYKAKEIYERHQIITKFWQLHNVSFENANKDACHMEHDISDETFLRIKEFVQGKK